MSRLIDDNSIIDVIDDNAVSCFVDDLGNTTCGADDPVDDPPVDGRRIMLVAGVLTAWVPPELLRHQLQVRPRVTANGPPPPPPDNKHIRKPRIVGHFSNQSWSFVR